MVNDLGRYSAPGAMPSATNQLDYDEPEANQSGVYSVSAPYLREPELFGNPYRDATDDLEPAKTPPTTNDRGYVAYRGSEQHGVRFDGTENGFDNRSAYRAEQRAFDHVVSDKVTPRDTSPADPIRVMVVRDASLLTGTRARATQYTLTVANGWSAITQNERYRTRLSLSASLAGAGTYAVIELCPDDNPNSLLAYRIRITPGISGVIFDTGYTGRLFARIVSTDDAVGVSVSMWAEYPIFDGEKVI